MPQKIVDFWMRQNEGLKIFYVIVIVLLLFWFKDVLFGSSEDNGVLGRSVAIIDTNGKPVNVERCSRINQTRDGKSLPRCKIFQDGFKVVEHTQIAVVLSKKAPNTTCVLTFFIGAEIHQFFYVIADGATCKTS